jgi:hypothetical protein
MKKISSLLCLIILVLSCQTDTKETTVDRTPVYRDFKNDLQARNLYGNIKTLTHTSTLNFEGKQSIDASKFKGIKTMEVYKYTKAGNVQTLESFGSSGRLLSITSYTYNKKDFVESFEIKQFFADGEKMISRNVNRYQNDSLLVSQKTFSNDVLTFHATYDHNLEENSIAQLLVVDNDTIQATLTNILDDQGRVVAVTSQSKDEAPKTLQTFTYDATGNLIVTIHKSGDKELRKEYTYKGKILKSLTSDMEDAPIANLPASFQEEYDASYNIIRKTYYDKDGAVLYQTKHEYEFDTVGNWIKSTTYSNMNSDNKDTFNIIRIETRDITYW